MATSHAMSTTVRRWVGAALPALCLVIAAAGCSEEKKNAPVADAGADSGPAGPVVGGKLGAALAAAAGGSAAPTAKSAPTAEGPPETGVFAPGVADTLHARTAPPKVELFSEGSDPKVALALAVAPGTKQKAVVSVGLRTGPQSAVPTLDFTIELKVEKPKAEKEKAQPSPPADGAPPEPASVLAEVVSVALSERQLGVPPKELAEQIAKVKGSQLQFRLTPSGGATDMTRQLPKDADPTLDVALGALAEAVGGLIPGLPDKPVGKGGYWMVTDRITASGADLMRYRVFRVQEAAAGRVTLSVEIRQFATDPKIEPLGLPKDIQVSIEQLDSQGKAEIDLASETLLPSRGQLSNRFVARLVQVNQPAKRMLVQMETTASVAPFVKPK